MHRRLPLPFFLLLALLAAAVLSAASCGGGENGTEGTAATNTTSASSGGDQAFESVIVEPPQAALTVELGGTATQAYQAFGVIGSTKTDISSECDWYVPSPFGSMSGATLTALPRGGATTVEATCDKLKGTSDLSITLRGSGTVGPNTPPNAKDLFDAAMAGSDPAKTPTLVYPIDGAVAPRNLPPIDVQWLAAQNDLFHVSLNSAFLEIDLYTTEISALMSPENWEAVSATTAGDSILIEVEGLVQADPTSRFVSPAVKLTMSYDTIDKTALYYWASSQGSLITQVFGTTTAPTPIKADCSSCHSVSRSGSRIGYSRCVFGDCAQIYTGFMRYDVPSSQWVDTVDANNKAIGGSFSTFAPIGYPFKDDKQSAALVTQWPGILSLFDPDTGAALPSNVSDVSTHGPSSPRSALMADWSPDGKSVVYASAPAGLWIDLDDGQIATMSYTYDGSQHTFSEPSFIVSQPVKVANGVYKNFFFPSYSSDGALIVFNAARGYWRNFQDAGAPGQRLMLTDNKGSWVVDLTAMNGEGDRDITWPHWAPGTTNDYYWIVFSSQRDYGHKVTAQNSNPQCIGNGVKQCKQLWIGAIDKTKVIDGIVAIDPSAPPVWLPGQDIGADNISPYWTVPVTEIPQ